MKLNQEENKMAITDLIEKLDQEIDWYDEKLNERELLMKKQGELIDKRNALFDEGTKKINEFLKDNWSSVGEIKYPFDKWSVENMNYYYDESSFQGFIMTSRDKKPIGCFSKLIEDIKKKDFQNLYKLEKAHFLKSNISLNLKTASYLTLLPAIYDLIIFSIKNLKERKYSIKKDREAISALLQKYHL